MLDEIISGGKRAPAENRKINYASVEKVGWNSFAEKKIGKTILNNSSLSRHLRLGKKSAESI